MTKNGRIDKTILDRIQNKYLIKRYIMFIFAVTLYALAYNIFFVKTDLILGGSGGIAILFKQYLTPSITIGLLSLLSICLSLLFMDRQFVINSIAGAILCPILVELTKNINISIPTDDMMLVAICGAVLIGISNGLSSKSGLSSGGIDTIIHILSRKFKLSHGVLYLIINGIIILCGGYQYGYRIILYALIILYIVSIITDKVVLGISSNKTFFIVTDKVEAVKEYLLENLSQAVTVLDAIGGYTNNKQEVLMAVVPTIEYFKAREGILEIDNNAFITITDSYQVYGGNKHKKKEVK
jgi:uncharacterized membrane-anchored protein YitT (DUF2179 family)